MAGPDAGPERRAAISGARRTWVWGGRPEPFALCLSLQGHHGGVGDLLSQAEPAFHATHRRSLTSALTQALLSVHEALHAENSDRPTEERAYASGVALALRSNGLYVAQAGETLVGSPQLGTVWARSWEAESASPRESRPLGDERGAAITTEFFPLAAGDALLVLLGLPGGQISAEALAGALDARPDLPTVSALLGQSREAAGLVIWWPSDDTEGAAEAPWVRWATASSVPVPVASATNGAVESWTAWIRVGPLAVLGLAVLLAIAVAWAVAQRLTAEDPGVAHAASLIDQAATQPDRPQAALLLQEAIGLLQPRADRNDQARGLLLTAQDRRDRLLSIVRAGDIERLPLPMGPQERSVSLWKSDDNHLFVLDLGAQLLYRTDLLGSRIEAWLRPGDVHADQPLGRLVSGAWSPPRGAGTDGRLLLVDNARSILSLNAAGTRRWWPPDSDQWQRIGPAAATHEDLFLLDAGRGQVWHYPARAALARATVAATTGDEPQLPQALDMATDGNLYVLLPGGSIRKLAPGGGKLPFDGTVPGQPLLAPVALFAHPDLDRLWVLEPAGSRVVEFTPTGDYVRQYAFPPNVLRSAISLHLDAEEGALRVLTAEHVLWIQIGQQEGSRAP